MPFKKYENDEEELLDLGRRFFEKLESNKKRYDPVKARAYYQKNRDTIIKMNRQYYLNHRTEYILYLRNYCTENRELIYKRDKLRSVVQNKIVQQDVDNDIEALVNEVMQPEEAPAPDDFTLRQLEMDNKRRSGRPKKGSKPRKPYTYVKQEGPFIMEFN